MRSFLRAIFAIILFLFVVLTIPNTAHAASLFPDAIAGDFDDVFNQFNQATYVWLGTSLSWAMMIFSGLATLEIVWSLTVSWIQNRDIASLLEYVFLRMMFVACGIGMINAAPQFITGGIHDFIAIGNSMGQNNHLFNRNMIDIDGIIINGLTIVHNLYNSWAHQNFITKTETAVQLAVASIIIIVSFTMVALQLLLTYLEAIICLTGGAFLLGFVASRWTMPYADIYPRMLLQCGMKLFSVTLLLSLGYTLADGWIHESLKTNSDIQTALHITSGSLMYGLLIWFLPAYVQSTSGASLAISATQVANATRTAAQSMSRSAAQVASAIRDLIRGMRP